MMVKDSRYGIFPLQHLPGQYLGLLRCQLITDEDEYAMAFLVKRRLHVQFTEFMIQQPVSKSRDLCMKFLLFCQQTRNT